jgi:hypothetical protein
MMPRVFRSGNKHRAGLYSGASNLPALSFGRDVTKIPNADTQILNVHNFELAPSLAETERGAIMLPDISVKSRDGQLLGDQALEINVGEFDPHLVRAALLLFDRIDYPMNNIFQFGRDCPPGLEGWSGFQRSRLDLTVPCLSEVIPTMVDEVLRLLNIREEGMWSVARGPTQELISADKLAPLSGLKMRLENALPLPAPEVAYDDVLSFKAHCRDELTALRHYIDGLALEVSQSGFSNYHQTVAFEKFDKALGDYCKVARKKNFLKRLTSLDISFDLTDASKVVIAGAVGATAILPSLESAAIGAALSLGIGVGLKNKVDGTVPSPFDYVFRAGKEM